MHDKCNLINMFIKFLRPNYTETVKERVSSTSWNVRCRSGTWAERVLHVSGRLREQGMGQKTAERWGCPGALSL